MIPLPIDPWLPEITARLARARALVIVASPGSGKTTRVPPALVDAGRVLVLQPRRVAARAIATRIAGERGWTLGHEVGWHVRFDRRERPDTRLIVATEGILTARLQADPLLSDVATIVLDEFHERSVHADLGLALARQAWLARDDLRLVVMSATLDAAPVARFLDDCPIIDVPGRAHPLDVHYRPGAALAAVVRDAASATAGSVLCFLPGAPEIRRAIPEVEQAVRALGLSCLPLHGSLDSDEQDAALESGSRRVILATNLAETTLTVPGVHAVVDTGLQKVARFDPDRGIDALDLERISQDSADQRAGRAGRLGPGLVWRLWDARDRLRPHREPELDRVDLSGPVLDVLQWGSDPRQFEWFAAPDTARVDAALALLTQLQLVADGRLTDDGRVVARWPVHPRLGRILLAGQGAFEAAAACALLAERHVLPPRDRAASCDLLDAIDRWSTMPRHVQRAAADLERLAVGALGKARTARISEIALRRALLAGYPDRVAQRRSPREPRLLLASGHGAVLGQESGVHDADYLIALDVQGATRSSAASESRVRLAARVEPDWLVATHVDTVHAWDDAAGRVRASVRDRYGALVLHERPSTPDAGEAAALLAARVVARGPDDEATRWLRRRAFAGAPVEFAAIVTRACHERQPTRASELSVDVLDQVAGTIDLERLAPDLLLVPSGRRVRLDYLDDGRVAASVKLQELFGLGDTPVLGPRRSPVVFHLLAPNGRPVQTTSDLRSFWERTYPEVRKELRGRYPRHPWPDDPWTAPPTARTTRRS